MQPQLTEPSELVLFPNNSRHCHRGLDTLIGKSSSHKEKGGKREQCFEMDRTSGSTRTNWYL